MCERGLFAVACVGSLMCARALTCRCARFRSDRIYTPLPLYHSAGGLIGVGLLFETGAFMVCIVGAHAR